MSLPRVESCVVKASVCNICLSFQRALLSSSYASGVSRFRETFLKRRIPLHKCAGQQSDRKRIPGIFGLVAGSLRSDLSLQSGPRHWSPECRSRSTIGAKPVMERHIYRGKAHLSSDGAEQTSGNRTFPSPTRPSAYSLPRLTHCLLSVYFHSAVKQR